MIFFGFFLLASMCVEKLTKQSSYFSDIWGGLSLCMMTSLGRLVTTVRWSKSTNKTRQLRMVRPSSLGPGLARIWLNRFGRSMWKPVQRLVHSKRRFDAHITQASHIPENRWRGDIASWSPRKSRGFKSDDISSCYGTEADFLTSCEIW